MQTFDLHTTTPYYLGRGHQYWELYQEVLLLGMKQSWYIATDVHTFVEYSVHEQYYTIESNAVHF